MKKIVLTLGTIAGLIMVAMFIISTPFAGEKFSELLGYSTMIIAFSTIFFGMRSYREKHLEGYITFGKAFQVGILITLVASFFYVVGWLIYSNTIATDFIDNYYQHSLEAIQNSGATQEVMDEKITKLQQSVELYENPFFNVVFTFLEVFPVGALITLISAVLVRKKAPEVSAEE